MIIKVLRFALCCTLLSVITSCRVLYDSDFLSYYLNSDKYPDGDIVLAQKSNVWKSPSSIIRDNYYSYYQKDFASLEEFLTCLLNNPGAFDFTTHSYNPNNRRNVKRATRVNQIPPNVLRNLEETEYGYYISRKEFPKDDLLKICKIMFDLGYVVDASDYNYYYSFHKREKCTTALQYIEEIYE